MAVPPRRRRAGKIEIDNKARKPKKKGGEEEPVVTPQEHEERLNVLRKAGLIK